MDAWQQFLQRYPTSSYQRGETILLKDMAPGSAFIIKKGIVKVYNISASGDEQPVSFDTKGELFPISWVFGEVEEARYFYSAFTPATVYKLPRDEYRQFLEAHPRVLLQRYERLAKQRGSLQLRINALQQQKAHEKILHTLLYMAEQFGEKINPLTARLKIPITQQELALFVGLTRETTSIELKKLEKSGVISYSRDQFKIKTKKLNQKIEDE